MTRHGSDHLRVAASGRPPGHSSRAQKLAREAAEAAELRSYQTHPDVVALRVERIRSQVDRLCWSGIVLGLAFTMTNVQAFAAAGAAPWSLPWLAAWLLDPMVSLVLLAILRAEQVTARYQVHTGRLVRRAKWFTLAATYVMNTWESYAAGSPSAIVLHSVPPLVVFAAAEAVTDLRDKLTEAVSVAFTEAAERITPAGQTNGSADSETVHESTQQATRRTGPSTQRSRSRKLFADYLAEARHAWIPERTITPAWVREVTGCSRGLSSRVAAALAAEVQNTGNTDGGEGQS